MNERSDMDTKTESIEGLLCSLTEEQIGQCVEDENQLSGIMGEGLSEANAVRFHRAMLTARRVNPDVTVEGLLEVALLVGLSFIGNEKILTRMNEARDGDVIVCGMEGKEGNGNGYGTRTGCTVSPDVEALAKLRRKKAQPKPRKPGVRGV